MRFMFSMSAPSFISSHLDFFSCHMNLMDLTRESEVHEFVQFHLTITHINGQVTRSFCVWMSRVIFSCDGRTKQPKRRLVSQYCTDTLTAGEILLKYTAVL